MPKTRESEKVVDIRARLKGKSESIDVDALKDFAVDQYTLHDYSLFALSKSKKPLKGSKTVNTPPDFLLKGSDFPDNYGVVLKPDDLVIDVDKRAFAMRVENRLVRRDGVPYSDKSPWASCSDDVLNELAVGEVDDPLKRFLEDSGLSDNLRTYIVRTGSGGYHVHFKIQPDIKTRLRLEDYPGLEFKRVGQYVVGPGSLHDKTGKPYVIKRASLKDILQAPDEMIGLLRRTARYDSIGLPDFVEDDAAIGAATAFYKTCPPAIEGDYGDPHTVEMARFGYDWALPPDKTFELMLEHFNPRCSPPWDDDQLQRKVYSAYKSSKDKLGNRHPLSDFADWEDEVDGTVLTEEEYRFSQYKNFTDKGKFQENDVGNTVAYLVDPEYRADEDGKTVRKPNPLFRIFRYNQLKEDVEFTRPAPWHRPNEKPMLNRAQEDYLVAFFSHVYGYRTNREALRAAIHTVALMARYNPVHEYLNALEWDGVSRLDSLLHRYVGADDTPLNAAIGKYVMLAAVYRTFEPGCQYDNVLVLEGPEGNGKSTFVRTLGGPFGRTVTIDIHNRKDTVQSMLGGWVLEAPEMVFARKYETNAVKEIITTPIDTVRLPFEPRAQDYERRSIVIGTCNPVQGGYLAGENGNRRYWPVKTGKIDNVGLKQDRDQLFAEAVARYRNKEQYWITDEALAAEMLERQTDREIKDSTIEHLQEIFERLDESDSEFDFIPEKPSLPWVAEQLGYKVKEVSPAVRKSILRSMEALGWDYECGRGVKGFFVRNLDKELEGLL